MEFVWQIFCEELTAAHEKHGLVIQSFVLMSNHFHMIASTPRGNISECMQALMTKTSLRLTRSGNRINETYAGRYKKTILQDPSYFLNAWKYNYRNPVAAGVCSRVEDYPFSSLQFLLRPGSRASFPLATDEFFKESRETALRWLNTAPDPAKVEAYKYGMRFRRFEHARHVVSRQRVIEVGELI